MPLILSRPTDAAKMAYLKSLFSEVYLKDIVERKKIKREDVLSAILDLLCSSIGSLTNPTKVAATINTVQKRSGENVVALNTVKAYMDHLSDSFLFTECKRWDVKGKSYFDYPNKYYCEDIGLRNARIGFRQQEMTHIMENIIFNELMIRECAVDIGIVYGNEKNTKGKVVPVAREIDFIATSGGNKTYIQSAYALGTAEKAITENKPFALTGDSFPKIIVRHDIRKRWYDDNGILNTAERAAAAIGRVDGVPFPAFLLGQIAVQFMEIQMEELLAVTHLRLRRRWFLRLYGRSFSRRRRGIFFHNSYFDFCGGFRIGRRAFL